AVLFALLLAIPALALFWIAMGLGTAMPTKPTPASRKRAGAADAPERDEPETNPIVDVALGAMVHVGYSLRTAFRRARENHAEKRAADTTPWRDDEVEPSMDGRAPVIERREPSLAAAPAPTRRIHAPMEPGFAPDPAPAPVSARINARPAYDETEIDYPEDIEDDDDLPFVPD